MHSLPPYAETGVPGSSVVTSSSNMRYASATARQISICSAFSMSLNAAPGTPSLSYAGTVIVGIATYAFQSVLVTLFVFLCFVRGVKWGRGGVGG
jgi:hypothetical protein